MALVMILVGAGENARAGTIGGGGRARTDCLSVFQSPVDVPGRRLVCTDGDVACDGDGTVNGVCVFPITVCGSSSFDPGRCTLVGVSDITVDHAQDNGDPKFDPDFQALQSRIDNQISPPNTDPDQCTGASNITVRVQGPFGNNRCVRGRKTLRLTARSTFMSGQQFEDADVLRLGCVPAPQGCSPTTFFTSTYDRVQRQIFDQSCALSACHDSESQAGGMLLETGAALGNLIDVTPTNPLADAAGWLRVTQTVAPDVNGLGGVGDPATSFLMHKVEGTLDPGMGAQMPFGNPPLPDSLIDILRLWITAGAPDVGWVPGTDQ